MILVFFKNYDDDSSDIYDILTRIFFILRITTEAICKYILPLLKHSVCIIVFIVVSIIILIL